MNLPSTRTVFSLITVYIFTIFVIIIGKNYLTNNDKTLFQQISYIINFTKDEHKLVSLKLTQTAKNETEDVCMVPKLDPWDRTILEFVSHERLLWCIQVQENMTFIDMDGYLRINETGIYFFKVFNEPFICHYRTFGLGARDGEVSYSQDQILTDPVKLKEDYVEVVCKQNNDTDEFYRNIHIHPVPKENRTFGNPNEDNLTVLLFYLDSVSYSVMQRNLPATYNYTKNVMKMTYFEAFNKIGDNTFPNAVALLTGKRVYDEQHGMMKEFEESYYKSTFDSWPLIWKNFSKKGYATMYNEDQPHWGLFHYGSKGFTKQPMDYYHRLYWLTLRWAADKNDTVYCFRNELKPQIMLDIMKRHLRTMNDTLQFMFNFYTELSHDYGSEIERYDDHLREFWLDMYENGYLNKTVVIFLSDHGHRFSAVRSTLVGLLEERLPFYAIWFPDWFYKLHPKIKENMKYNKNVLTTPFDAHETLVDILNSNYNGKQRSSNSRGQSQLYALPNRTCAQAGIPDHYCTCVKEVILSVNHPDAMPAAEYLVSYINSLLTNVSELCETVRFSKIIFFRQLDHNEKVKQGIKNFGSAREMDAKLMNGTKFLDKEKNYRIGIVTEPFSSSFEATVKLVESEDSTIVLSIDGNSVSRINAYKTSADCITNQFLKKYCTCKNAINIS